MWKWHQWISGVLPIIWTENNWNRTIFNETGFELFKKISHVISLIMVRIISFSGAFSSGRHKESIGNTFINTSQKHEHFMW